MTRQPTSSNAHFGEPLWVAALARSTPQAPLMAPYMVYLLFMLLDDFFPDHLLVVAWLIRSAAALWTAWLFRHHFPPFGKAHWGLAIPVGLFAAWGWVAGQHLFDGLGILGKSLSLGSLLSGHPTLFAALPEPFDAHARIAAPAAYWTHVALKLGYTSTVVPLVEELFWRAFLLRALISWDRFDTVPLGRFAWVSFVGTALLSTLQHPANWGVSIPCWLLFNALFCWKKSILCLIITHGVTNLALYAYVVAQGDWRFW